MNKTRLDWMNRYGYALRIEGAWGVTFEHFVDAVFAVRETTGLRVRAEFNGEEYDTAVETTRLRMRMKHRKEAVK